VSDTAQVELSSGRVYAPGAQRSDADRPMVVGVVGELAPGDLRGGCVGGPGWYLQRVGAFSQAQRHPLREVRVAVAASASALHASVCARGVTERNVATPHPQSPRKMCGRSRSVEPPAGTLAIRHLLAGVLGTRRFKWAHSAAAQTPTPSGGLPLAASPAAVSVLAPS
jgi:hypothetical protein